MTQIECHLWLHAGNIKRAPDLLQPPILLQVHVQIVVIFLNQFENFQIVFNVFFENFSMKTLDNVLIWSLGHSEGMIFRVLYIYYFLQMPVQFQSYYQYF